MTTTTHARARELTDWYSPLQHPVREGVYELVNTSTGMHFFSNWHCGAWAIACMTAENAAMIKTPSIVQDRWPWRGRQGDEHSLQIGSSMFLVEFSEGPDRPGDDE